MEACAIHRKCQRQCSYNLLSYKYAKLPEGKFSGIQAYLTVRNKSKFHAYIHSLCGIMHFCYYAFIQMHFYHGTNTRFLIPKILYCILVSFIFHEICSWHFTKGLPLVGTPQAMRWSSWAPCSISWWCDWTYTQPINTTPLVLLY